MGNTKSIGIAYSDQDLDASTLGATGGTLGFFGTTPVTQPTVVAAVTTTGATSTTNAYGYTTAAQADAIVTAINDINTRLQTLGLFASA